MPPGANLEVHEQGYRFTPYYSWSSLRGRKWIVRAREEGLVDEQGHIHGTIRIDWHGFPMATNQFVLRRVVIHPKENSVIDLGMVSTEPFPSQLSRFGIDARVKSDVAAWAGGAATLSVRQATHPPSGARGLH